MPKETGIIMSGSHPVDILEGLKTMTRRVIKFKPFPNIVDSDWHAPWLETTTNQWVFSARFGLAARSQRIKCPYGQVGDKLWVRETWATENRYNHLKPSEIPRTAKIFYLTDGYDPFEMGKVRSPLFMPRWASRILLEITEVRVERVQEITNEDAKAEGVTPMTCCLPGAAHYITPFKELWDSLNAKRGYPWANNDWVWPIRFRMIEQ